MVLCIIIYISALVRRKINMVEHYTKSLPYELELTSRVLHEAAKCYFEQCSFPITPEEFTILDCLYLKPDIIQIDLAKMILKGRAHTGRFLKSLEEKNLIVRKPVRQGSKTITKNIITKEGLNLYKKICSEIDKYIAQTNPDETVQISDVIKLLQEIRKNCTERFNIKFD